MSNLIDLNLARAHGLPSRPVQSYKSPTRRLRGRGKTTKHQLNNNQENQWPEFRAPSRLAHRPQAHHQRQHQPLANRTNIQNIPPAASLSPLPSKRPSKLNALFILPAAPQPAPWTPFGHNLMLGTSQLPCPQPGPFPEMTPITPVTRRRLAVEGIRKAASNAAVRKMGLFADFGCDSTLIPSSFPKSVDGLFQQLDNIPTTPREYRSSTPVVDGSTTPCDTSFVHDAFDPDAMVFADVDDGSTTPIDTSYVLEHCESFEMDDLRLHSSTPLQETSFTLEPSDSLFSFESNFPAGSTTPCDNSFADDDLGVGTTTPCDTSFSNLLALPAVDDLDQSSSPCETSLIIHHHASGSIVFYADSSFDNHITHSERSSTL